MNRLFRRKVPPDLWLTPELAHSLAEISHDTGRQIGIFLSREGAVMEVLVGTTQEIYIEKLPASRGGDNLLRGLTLVHTHLRGEPLSQDDLNDLALLRLDAQIVLHLRRDTPDIATFSLATLSPDPLSSSPWVLESGLQINARNLEGHDRIEAIEEEMRRVRTSSRHRLSNRERAILVSVSPESVSSQEENIAELRELADSAGVDVLGVETQRVSTYHPSTLMSRDRLKSLIIHALQVQATLIIFEQNLSPAQVKTIADMTELKVIDRTQLILDIFARRAHSSDGKLQVELAQLRYLLPRLERRSTALSRLTGGIGGRGPGETRLEEDRRRVRDRISHLSQKLERVGQERQQRKERRKERELPIVSLVGYTNVGKSTLLNRLTGSDVLTENKMFATLDPTTRRLRFPQEREIILTDTVGFIRNLPGDLKRAFLATFDELKDAHLLIHVADASHVKVADQIERVDELLKEMELERIPCLLVLNKIDLLSPEERTVVAARFPHSIPISALDLSTLSPLLKEMETRLFTRSISDDPDRILARK
ncbi:MAG: GTPase HflX [Leptospirales bacterium]